MNILILSVGTRNKIIQYLKKTLGETGKVICTDMSPISSAIYEADKYYLVPPITDEKYIDCVLAICKEEEIDGVISLTDPELSLLARNVDRFSALGVVLIGSSYELCERALDKYEMYIWLIEHGYKCARSYIDKEKFYKDVECGNVEFPVFVKPIRGSASMAISKADDAEVLELLLKKSEGMMIQEFIKGQEIGADVYIDLISGEVVSIFTKKKLKMRAGETQDAVSFKDEKLFELIEEFVVESGYRGQIDIDIFDVNGEYYINEVNPRFGGGYPHAFESGVNHMEMIVNNLKGIVNTPVVGENYSSGIYMMKYNEIMVRRDVV